MKEKLSDFIYLNCAIKINKPLGFVLHDSTETRDYRYLYPADNNPFLELLLRLANKNYFDQMERKIEQKGIFEQIVSHRPNFKRKVSPANKI